MMTDQPTPTTKAKTVGQRRRKKILKDVEAALRASKGIYTAAAHILARKYGKFTPNTVKSYVIKYPQLQAVMDGNREPNGRILRTVMTKAELAKKEATAMQIVIEARCKAAGVWVMPIHQMPGETDAQFKARQDARQRYIDVSLPFVAHPWMGTNAGRRIAGEIDADGKSEALALWQVIQTIVSRRAAYLRALEAPSEHASIVHMPVTEDEGAETGVVVESRSDIRGPEEKADDALRAWNTLSGELNRISPHAERGILETVIFDKDVPSFPLPQILRKLKKSLD